MKVDRTGALHNSYICTRCLRGRHLANRFNSRRRQTSLRACSAELVPRCVDVRDGAARKKVADIQIYPTRNPKVPATTGLQEERRSSVCQTYCSKCRGPLLVKRTGMHVAVP